MQLKPLMYTYGCSRFVYRMENATSKLQNHFWTNLTPSFFSLFDNRTYQMLWAFHCCNSKTNYHHFWKI